MRTLPSAILIYAACGASFADLWGNLNIAGRYALLQSFPKGGDIHNHLSGTGQAEKWLEFGRKKVFWTRHSITATGNGQSAVLWETIPACEYREKPKAERKQFKRLDKLSKDDQEKWVEAVRVLGKAKPRAQFYEQSFKVLGGLTDNLYVKTEILVYWIKQLGSENAVYLETMTGLNFVESTRDGCKTVDKNDAWQHIRQRLEQPDVTSSQVQVYFQHHVPRTHKAKLRLEKTISFLNSGYFPKWVGGNLVGPEHDDRGALDVLLDEHISAELSTCERCRWSVHAGELRSKNRNVLDAIEKFNASRIGHGLNWFDDGAIMKDTLASLRKRDILIETNLISNKVLEILEYFQDHPLKKLLKLNIPTCLSTDDSAMWGSTLTDEYMLAAELLPKESLFRHFRQMGLNSLKYSFAPENVKKRQIQAYKNRLEQFERDWLDLKEFPAKDMRTPHQVSTFACTQWPVLCPSKRVDFEWCAKNFRGLTGLATIHKYWKWFRISMFPMDTGLENIEIPLWMRNLGDWIRFLVAPPAKIVAPPAKIDHVSRWFRVSIVPPLEIGPVRIEISLWMRNLVSGDWMRILVGVVGGGGMVGAKLYFAALPRRVAAPIQ